MATPECVIKTVKTRAGQVPRDKGRSTRIPQVGGRGVGDGGTQDYSILSSQALKTLDVRTCTGGTLSHTDSAQRPSRSARLLNGSCASVFLSACRECHHFTHGSKEYHEKTDTRCLLSTVPGREHTLSKLLAWGSWLPERWLALEGQEKAPPLPIPVLRQRRLQYWTSG